MIDYTDTSLRQRHQRRGRDQGRQHDRDRRQGPGPGAQHRRPAGQARQIYDQQVSATLGKDSLRQALIAGVIGLGIVLIYMLFYYRFLGLIADLALIIYAMLLWGVFNAIPVTLTLPGIAGMILTIGVAADANVVIFERIKEEVRAGKTVRSAVSSGYARGFQTILDANILTMLTAAGALHLRQRAAQGLRPHAHPRCAGQHVHRHALATRAMLGVLADFAFFNKAGVHGCERGADRRRRTCAPPPTRHCTAARRRRAAGASGAPGRRVASGRRARSAPRTATPARKDGPRTATSRRKKKRR